MRGAFNMEKEDCMTTGKHTQMFVIVVACAVCFAALSAPAWGGEEGTASGTFTLDGKTAKLGHAYAMAQPNTFEKDKTDIAVLITERPLQNGALGDLEDLLDAVQDMKESSWVFFKIDDSGKPVFETIYQPVLGENRLMMSGFTHAEFHGQAPGKGRTEGTFRTKKAEEFVGHAYELDVTFKAPVVQAKRPEPLPDAKSGKALPRDGGEPGKAYMAYHAALMKKDIAEFRKFAPETVKGKKLTDKEIQEGMEFMGMMTPPKPAVEKGFINTEGERAVLYITGMVENEKNYGTIEMIKSDGKWRVNRESWSNTPPEK